MRVFLILMFIMGFLSAYLINYSLTATGLERPFGFSFTEGVAPGNWINAGDITILPDKVVFNVKNASLSFYADSGSMIPTLDKDANGIRVVPETDENIHVGDIVTYQSGEDLIVHRVVEKGQDENGAYFVMKGDNNDFSDGKIRFIDIKYVTVALIY